jgi:hypothetical protein
MMVEEMMKKFERLEARVAALEKGANIVSFFISFCIVFAFLHFVSDTDEF